MEVSYYCTFEFLTFIPLIEIQLSHAHSWRYAISAPPSKQRFSCALCTANGKKRKSPTVSHLLLHMLGRVIILLEKL